MSTRISKPIGNIMLDGEVYDFYTPYWRVRYKDNNWEELSKRERDSLRVKEYKEEWRPCDSKSAQKWASRMENLALQGGRAIREENAYLRR